jgi:hypothetical protein
LAPEVFFNSRFEVEHIVPRSRDGTDDLENFALACRGCNLLKSDQIEHNDPVSDTLVRLFHPRTDRWADQFSVSREGIVEGITPVGRATVELLQWNSPQHLTARRHWLRLGIY